MPSRRRAFQLGLCLLWVLGCEEQAPKKAPAAAMQRFAAVQPPAVTTAAKRFCERTFPASGAEARPYAAPPERPLPAGVAKPKTEAAAKGWTWVNIWATWCKPCMEEMTLLGRWRDGLAHEGTSIALDLLSADASEAEEALRQTIQKGLPGPVRWLRDPEDLPGFLKQTGVDESAALPIHLLVDPKGMLRCVRVGAIHEQDYGSIKQVLKGG